MFFIRGKHPVCGEPLFCLSANPDSLSELCGFHIDHRSRSFLLQVSGVSSRLSFCCTSLVSGFIIHGSGRFVYSQSTQVLTESFAKMTIKLFQLHNSFRELPTCLPGHNFRRAAAAGGAVHLSRAGFRAVFCCVGAVSKSAKTFGPFVDEIAQNGRNPEKTLMQQEFLCYHTGQ